MPEGRAHRSPQPGDRAGEDVLAPVLLPFTIVTTGGVSAEGATERSLGHRLGVWWEETGDEDGGVVVTGIKPDGAAAAGQALAVGDTIVEADGAPVHTLADLVQRVGSTGGPVELTVKSASDGSQRSVTVSVPPAAPTLADGPVAPPTAHVPTTDLVTSIKRHIECILCNPVQSEVTHPGVAADPDFGCLGADLEFSIQSVGFAEMRNAIVQGERRLRDVDVSSLELEVREAGETHVRPGVRVEARLAAGGEPVKVDLEVIELTSKRRTNRLRRRYRRDEEAAR